MARQPTTIQKSATPIVPNSVSAIDALNKPAARASSMGVLFPMNAKPRPLRTRAISGSQPWAIHTDRFYRESAGSLSSRFLGILLTCGGYAREQRIANRKTGLLGNPGPTNNNYLTMTARFENNALATSPRTCVDNFQG
jgi:hypothetical protein